jgi:hypothetical protein
MEIENKEPYIAKTEEKNNLLFLLLHASEKIKNNYQVN